MISNELCEAKRVKVVWSKCASKALTTAAMITELRCNLQFPLAVLIKNVSRETIKLVEKQPAVLYNEVTGK